MTDLAKYSFPVKTFLTSTALIFAVFFLYKEVTSTFRQLSQVKQVKLKNNPNQIEAFIKSANIKRFNHGQIQYILSSPEITYQSIVGNARISQPQLKIYKKQIENNQTTLEWHVQAKHGTFFSDQEKINLKQGVLIKKQAKNLQNKLELSTENIDIFPKNSYAKTTHTATIINNSSKLSSIGIGLDFKRQQYQLLGKVNFQEF